jgi:DNA-binding IclR family transcriptional regulator
MGDPPLASVQSVDRAVSALEFLARQGEAGVSDVAGAVGVHKSTASRLLGVLQARGLVEVAGERGRYRLGYGILRLAAAMGGTLDVTIAGREICDDLAAQSGETVNIAVLQDDHVINVYQAQGVGSVMVNNWVGRPTPVHATSSGKILLAMAPEPLRRRLIERRLERFTDVTVVDPKVLRQHLERAVAQGFATTEQEYEAGLNAVAAPVFGAAGQAVAAISLSGPAYRLPPAQFPAAAVAVMAAAARVSERMGYHGRQ